jgi:CheY-like chemotaxis protein
VLFRSLGLGSEFVLRLPVLVAAEPPAGGGPAAVREEEGAATIAAGRKVLVVDDNTDAAEALAKLLRHKGYEVRVANDGPRALEVTATHWPEVVLLDIGLPGMDGYEVCQRIRRQGLSGAQIVALTGFGQARDRQRSQEAGFDAHLVKPVELGELLKLLSVPSRQALAH